MLSIIKKISLPSLLEGKIRKSAVVITSLSLIVASGFFLYQALAAGVTPAYDGTNISLDTSNQASGGGSYTNLTEISFEESSAGEIAIGWHTFTLPAGFRFKPNSNITLGANWSSGFSFGHPISVLPDTGGQSFSFNVSSQSNEGTPATIVISDLQIQPTNTTPTSGAITHSGSAIANVTDGAEGTSFGEVSSVVGVPVNTYIETAVAGSGNTPLEMTSQTIVAGASLSEVYSVRRDQFDNFIDNYEATWTMESETGGIVDGDLVPAGNSESAIFTSNKVGTAIIRATVAGTTSIDSALITVTPAAPDAPTATDGPIINEAEETAGFVVQAPLGTSGAIEGDTLELLLGGSSFPTILARTLDATDISNGYYDFTVVSGQLGIDGVKTITSKVTDNGNVGPEGPALGLTLDTTAPNGYSVAIDTDPVNNINETNFTFTFTGAEVGATYNYSIDDTNGGTSAVTGSGIVGAGDETISGIDVSSLDDDSLTLTVSLTDEAGNVGLDTTDTVTKDTVAPTVSETTPVAVNVNDLTPDYTFNSNEAGVITYGGSCSSATSLATVGDNTVIFNTLTESLHNDCTVSVTDATGNVSNVLTVTAFTVDVTAPSVVLTTGVSDPTNVSPISVTAEFSEDVSGFEVGDIAVGNGSAGDFVAVDGDTYTFNITPSGQGSVTIDVAGGVAQDAATNANTTATQLARVYDNVAPSTLSISSYSADIDINITNKNGQTISGTAEEDSIVKLYVDDVEKVSITATSGNFSFSNADLITAGIVSGTDYWATPKVVTLRATDAAENESVDSDSITYRQDTIVPDVNAGTDKVVNAQVSQDATVSDSGSGIATYLWAKDTGTGNITFGTGTVEDTTIEADADETYTISLTVEDNAGNSALDTINFKWDTTVPTVAITYNPVSPVGEGTVTVTATYSEPISGTPNIDIDQAGTTDISGVAMTDSGDQTIWTYDYTVYEASATDYVDGTATVSLSATADPAGNASAGPTNNTFVIDTGAPVIAIDSPADDDVIKTTNGTVTVATTVTDASSYTCAYKVDSGTYQTTACDGDIVDGASFTDGRHTLTMKAVDDGGNFSEDSVSIVIDANNDLTVAGSGADFALIQTAVDKATGGDSISIGAGTFSESVDVAKQLTINGSGNDSTIVDPAVGSYGFKITADGVSINNLQIQTEFVLNGTDDSGIIIREADNLTLSGNKIISASGTDVNGAEGSLGIWVCGTESGCTGSNNLTVDQNIITINGVSTGMYAEQVDSAHSGWSVTNNTITANDGVTIELYDVTSSTVDNNTFDGSVTNSNVIWSSQRADITDLTFTDNTVSDSSGSMVAFMSDIWVLGDGLDNTSVSTVLISGNTFNTWGSRGLRIGADVSGVTISANVFTGGTGESVKNESVNPVTASGNTYSDFATNPGYPTAFDIFDGTAYTGGTDATPVGALDASASTVTITSPVVADGTSEATITITAIGNDGGNILAGVPASKITFVSNGSDNTLTQPSVDTDGSGVTTAKLKSTMAETKTVTVTIDGVELTSEPSAVFQAGAIDHYIMTPGTITDQVAGVPFAVTLQAQDVNNNDVGAGHADAVETINIALGQVDTGVSPVTIDTVDGTIVANITLTVAQAGQTLNFTGATSGKTTGVSNTFDVTPGEEAYLVVTADSGAPTAGGDDELTIRAYDAYGNVATGYTGGKSLTFSGLSVAPLGAEATVEGTNVGSVTSVNFTTGVSDAGVVTLVAKKAEVASLDVTDGSISSSGDEAYDVDLTVLPATATALSVGATPNPLTTAETSDITVVATDTYGNTADSSATVDFLYSGDGITMTPSTEGDLVSGELSATMSKVSAGSVILTVQSAGLTSDNISVVFTDGTAPTVITNPSIGDLNVLRTIQPIITFSEAMTATTTIADNIKIKKYTDDSDIGAVVTVINDTQVRLVPATNLDYNTEYFFFISSGVLDANFVSFAAWDDSNKDAHKFTTEVAEAEVPYVTNWSPTDGSKDVEADTTITLNFNEKLTATTGTVADKFKLRPYSCENDACNVDITTVYDGDKQVVITPNVSLDYGTQYYIYIISTLKDLVGNEFGSSWQSGNKDQHEFTTIKDLVIDAYTLEKGEASDTNLFTDGWRYRFDITSNNIGDSKLFVLFSDWVGSGTIPASGNMKFVIDESTGGAIQQVGGWTEGLISSGSGNIKSYSIENAYDLFSTVTGLDNNGTKDGKQLTFYAFVKIPEGTTPGSYNSTYGIKTE